MLRTLVLGCIGTLALMAQTPAPSPLVASGCGKNLWRASAAALVVAHAADLHSSWGKPETNAMLAGANGRLGARGAALKFGFQSSLLAAEHVVLRRSRGVRPYRVLAIVNFAAAAVIGGIAARNYGLPRAGTRAYQPTGLP